MTGALLAIGLSLAPALPQVEPAAEPPADIESRVWTLLGQNRWRDALDLARENQSRNPDDPRALSALGQALYRAGRLDLAAPLLERVSLSPRGLATLGRLREAQGRDDEAMALFDTAVAGAPDDREILFAAAGATATRGVAILRYERYLERSAGDLPERVESAQSAIGVLRALGERATWVVKARPERIEVALTRLWDPASGGLEGFVVRVGLGPGKPVPLLLDSGNGGLHVIERVARKRGFAPLAEATVFGGGGTGRHETTHGIFEALDLGGLRFSDVLATVKDGEVDPTGRYHGILGLSALAGYRITIDLARDLLLLEPLAEQSSGQSYWTVGGQWLVQAGLGPETAMFLFDTGATQTIVDLGAAMRLAEIRAEGAARVVGFGGAVAGARAVTGIEVTYQGQSTAQRPLVGIDLARRGELGGVEVSGYLGLDLLDGARVVIDTAHQRIALERLEPVRGKKRPKSPGGHER